MKFILHMDQHRRHLIFLWSSTANPNWRFLNPSKTVTICYTDLNYCYASFSFLKSIY